MTFYEIKLYDAFILIFEHYIRISIIILFDILFDIYYIFDY